jgi:hypothetical protein
VKSDKAQKIVQRKLFLLILDWEKICSYIICIRTKILVWRNSKQLPVNHRPIQPKTKKYRFKFRIRFGFSCWNLSFSGSCKNTLRKRDTRLVIGTETVAAKMDSEFILLGPDPRAKTILAHPKSINNLFKVFNLRKKLRN